MKEEFRADKELVGDGWRGAGRKSRIWICPCLEKDTKANTSQPPHAYTPTHWGLHTGFYSWAPKSCPYKAWRWSERLVRSLPLRVSSDRLVRRDGINKTFSDPTFDLSGPFSCLRRKFSYETHGPGVRPTRVPRIGTQQRDTACDRAFGPIKKRTITNLKRENYCSFSATPVDNRNKNGCDWMHSSNWARVVPGRGSSRSREKKQRAAKTIGNASARERSR